MDHCAIDLGGKKSQLCIRNQEGVILQESRCDTAALPELLRELPRPSRVIVETMAEAFRIADAALAAGHQVRVVPATLVRSLGVGSRGVKTDRRDAQILSEVSCRIDLPSVHIPSARSREWKTICSIQDVLTSSRTKLINNVRGWMRGQGFRTRSGYTASFSKRVRELGPMPSYIEAQLATIDAVSQQIAASEKRLEDLADNDEICTRLMTVPGVGPSTAVRFAAAIDELSRFPDAHKLESYLGLTPGESSSSERQQRLGITKAGPKALRWVLVQAAWGLRINCRTPLARPLQLWAAEIEKRRGKNIATVALARKLAGILYALWRDGTVFRPQ
jgi:transposase